MKNSSEEKEVVGYRNRRLFLDAVEEFSDAILIGIDLQGFLPSDPGLLEVAELEVALSDGVQDVQIRPGTGKKSLIIDDSLRILTQALAAASQKSENLVALSRSLGKGEENFPGACVFLLFDQQALFLNGSLGTIIKYYRLGDDCFLFFQNVACCIIKVR